jgi:predicted NBD/HSP70 family sugar kinase
VENAENAATLGEYYFGAADNVHNLVYLVVGYGLGGGIIVRGTLLRGSRGQAGKIGHMVMVPDGVPCRCGKRGCLQTLVNTPAIVRRMQEALEASAGGEMQALVASKLGRIDAEMVVEAAEEGDSTAQMVIEEFGVHLGRAISTLVNLLNPELVVLGGAFSLAGPFLLGVVEQVIQEHATLESYKAVKLVTSTHGAEACTIGAAALVLDEFLQEPLL